jgi:hypothetical protein
LDYRGLIEMLSILESDLMLNEHLNNVRALLKTVWSLLLGGTSSNDYLL